MDLIPLSSRRLEREHRGGPGSGPPSLGCCLLGSPAHTRPCAPWSRWAGTGREQGLPWCAPLPQAAVAEGPTNSANTEKPILAHSQRGRTDDHRGHPFPAPHSCPAPGRAPPGQTDFSTGTEGPRAALGQRSPALPGPQSLARPQGLARTHISVMVSGRLAGMAVRPLPRQSTMPLLQLHMAGQEPEERVQAGTCPASPWPAETVRCDLGRPCRRRPPETQAGK